MAGANGWRRAEAAGRSPTPALIVAAAIGAVVGGGSDELLRGRDPRSWLVLAAGVAGVTAGVVAPRAFGDDGFLIGCLTALMGALLLGCGTRVRLSAAIARTNL